MAIRRIPIDELVGINRNATHGAAQSAPVEIKGFDLDRLGGYVAAWKQADEALVTGLSGVIRSYDPYGNALFADAQVLLGGSLSDQSTGSIGGRGSYLVPRVGVFSNAGILGGDEYELGGYFKDAFGDTGDLNRVSGLTTSASGTGSGIGDGTYRFLVLVEVPTVHGFVTYQTLTAEQAASSNDSIAVELDTALPSGYAARAYWWLSGGDEVSFTQIGFRKISDGTAISFTFDDDTVDVTTDAILSFSQDLRRVEPHRQRIWGVAGPQAFVGPYVAGFTVEQRFRANPSSGEFLLSTPDSGTLDGLASTDTMSVFAQFNEGISWQASTDDVVWRVAASSVGLEKSRYAHDVAIDQDGNVFAVLNKGTGSPDSALTKIDADGAEVWTSTTVGNSSEFVAVDVDKNGNVYTLEHGTGGGDVVVREFNSVGTLQWSTSLSLMEEAVALAVKQDGSRIYATGTRADNPDTGLAAALDGSGSVLSNGVGNPGFQVGGVTADPEGFVAVGWYDSDSLSVQIRRYTEGYAAIEWTRSESAVAHQPTALAWSSASAVADSLDVVVLYSDPEFVSSSPAPYVVRLRGSDGGVHASNFNEVSDHTSASARSITVGPGGQILVAGRRGNHADVLVLDSETLEVLEVMDPSPSGAFTWAVATNRRGEVAAGTQADAGFPGDVVRLRSTHSWAPIAVRGDQFETGVVFSLGVVGGANGETARFYAFKDGMEAVSGKVLTNDANQEVWDHGSPTTVLRSLKFEYEMEAWDEPLRWQVRNSAGTITLTDAEERLHWPGTFMASTDADLKFGGATTLSGGDLRHDWLWTELYDDDSQTTTLASAEAEDWSTGATFTSSETGETWTIDDDAGGVEGGLATFSSTLSPSTTLIYSSVGGVNTGTDENYVQLELLSSQRITALSSTPAGLVAFCDNESFLVRGDPAVLDSFQVQRLSGTVGCDAGTQPGRLGNVVFPIWRGRIYSLSLGMGDVDFGSGLADISPPVFDPGDPFVQVIGEPRSRQVIARTDSGVILRYVPERQAWFTDVYSGEGVSLLVPDDGDVGTRYRLSDELWLAVAGADSPNVKWEQVDLGDKLLRKLWRRFYLYTNDGYDGDPVLEYEINGNSGSVTGLSEGTGQWSFTLPHGIVSSTAQVLNMVMEGATEHDAMEQPMEIEVVDRYRRR